MADPFLAEIRIFPFKFAPRGWAWCNGQLMSISQNTALFALLGTYYGGDGRTTFGLPDLSGAAPMHSGQGSGLSERNLGDRGGSDAVTLLQSEIPIHTHQMLAARGTADLQGPAPDRSLAQSQGGFAYAQSDPNTFLAPSTITPAGGDLPHNNMQPYLTFFFAIALQGIFPPRP